MTTLPDRVAQEGDIDANLKTSFILVMSMIFSSSLRRELALLDASSLHENSYICINQEPFNSMYLTILPDIINVN